MADTIPRRPRCTQPTASKSQSSPNTRPQKTPSATPTSFLPKPKSEILSSLKTGPEAKRRRIDAPGRPLPDRPQLRNPGQSAALPRKPDAGRIILPGGPPTSKPIAPPLRNVAPPPRNVAPPLKNVGPPLRNVAPPLRNVTPALRNVPPPATATLRRIPTPAARSTTAPVNAPKICMVPGRPVPVSVSKQPVNRVAKGPQKPLNLQNPLAGRGRGGPSTDFTSGRPVISNVNRNGGPKPVLLGGVAQPRLLGQAGRGLPRLPSVGLPGQVSNAGQLPIRPFGHVQPALNPVYDDWDAPDEEDLDFIDDCVDDNEEWKNQLRRVTGYDPRKFAHEIGEASVSTTDQIKVEEKLSEQIGRREDAEEFKKTMIIEMKEKAKLELSRKRKRPSDDSS